MRLVIDSLVALMLAGVLAGVILHHRQQNESAALADALRDNVRTFQRQITLEATLARVPLTDEGYPTTVDPEWFADGVPVNPLLNDGRPWVEVAGVSQRDLEHPIRKVARERDDAQYWYNPYNGIVRARVPSTLSDAVARELYNYVNDASVATMVAPTESWQIAGTASSSAALPVGAAGGTY